MLYHGRTVPMLNNWHVQKCCINPWNLMCAPHRVEKYHDLKKKIFFYLI